MHPVHAAGHSTHSADAQLWSWCAYFSKKNEYAKRNSAAETICMVQVHASHDVAAKPKAVVVGAGW